MLRALGDFDREFGTTCSLVIEPGRMPNGEAVVHLVASGRIKDGVRFTQPDAPGEVDLEPGRVYLSCRTGLIDGNRDDFLTMMVNGVRDEVRMLAERFKELGAPLQPRQETE